MYNEIIVPLDGSELAEAALPHARSIANAFKSDITLISVIEPITIYPQPGAIGPVLSVAVNTQDEIDNATKYLKERAEYFSSEDINVRTIVKEGDPASEICDLAEESNADLIIMSTHGRSGIKRWVYGSVADKVLRSADIPVLLVRAHKP